MSSMDFQDLDFVFTDEATGTAQSYDGGDATLQITAGAWSTGTASVQVSFDGGTRYVAMKDINSNALTTLSADAMYNISLGPCLIRVVVATATITTGQMTIDTARHGIS